MELGLKDHAEDVDIMVWRRAGDAVLGTFPSAQFWGQTEKEGLTEENSCVYTT